MSLSLLSLLYIWWGPSPLALLIYFLGLWAYRYLVVNNSFFFFLSIRVNNFFSPWGRPIVRYFITVCASSFSISDVTIQITLLVMLFGSGALFFESLFIIFWSSFFITLYNMFKRLAILALIIFVLLMLARLVFTVGLNYFIKISVFCLLFFVYASPTIFFITKR